MSLGHLKGEGSGPGWPLASENYVTLCMCGRGACMAGAVHGRGACMAGGHAWGVGCA